MGSYQGSINKSLFFSLLIFSASVFADAFVYMPKYRAADELKTSVEAFLEGEGKINAISNKLVISASKEKIEEITAILAELDKGARQLLVQVRSRGKKKAESESIEIIDPTGKPTVSGGAVSEKTKSANLNTVTVVEGADAFISTENGGFNAVVRVTGKTVILDIYQRTSRLRKDGISHSYNSLATSIHGQLDEWIDLGQIESSDASKSRYTVGGSNAKAASKEEVSVRVRLAK